MLYTNSGKIHVLNVLNNGAIKGLDDDAVIETNCIVTSSGARPITTGTLPSSIKGLVHSVKAYEQLTIEASVESSKNKALLALINNPLVHGADVAQNILEQMIEAHKEHLSYLK